MNELEIFEFLEMDYLLEKRKRKKQMAKLKSTRQKLLADSAKKVQKREGVEISKSLKKETHAQKDNFHEKEEKSEENVSNCGSAMCVDEQEK